jgi:tetratricopeptide (TPR) repeat protein
LAEGETAAAVAELEAAKALLPAETALGDDGIQVRHDLARAYLADGQPSKAKQELGEIVEAASAPAVSPVEFVRSLYLLGEIEESQGNNQQARQTYQRFLDYWADGDLDRDQVEHAEQVVGSS